MRVADRVHGSEDHETKFLGVLYLENNLAPRVFAPARTAVLKLLGLQAAMALENTQLYRDLAERESRIRRLVDAKILGICIWNLEGAIVEANEAFLYMLQYSREDVVSGRCAGPRNHDGRIGGRPGGTEFSGHAAAGRGRG